MMKIETWQITIVRAPEISVMINASLKIAIKVAICEHQLSYESRPPSSGLKLVQLISLRN